MQKWLVVFTLVAVLNSCSDKRSKKRFEVSGIISNSSEKTICLVAPYDSVKDGIIVMTGKITVASSAIGKDGRYSLVADASESAVYELTLYGHGIGYVEYDFRDQGPSLVDPSLLAFVINDVPKITINADMSKESGLFTGKYEVEGSPASRELKDFITAVDKEREKIYFISHQADSLQKMNAPDSVIAPLIAKRKKLADNIRNILMTSLDKANDPALAMHELQICAPVGTEFGLEPLDVKQVIKTVNDIATRFPAHQRLASMKKTINEVAKRIEERMQQQAKQEMASSLVGKEAPDFSLPDAKGKEIKLSSFRGKYVLVDFWASWCKPCREENPNVVNAYNQFRNKNFTILGVSLDHPGQKDKWLDAVKTDDLSWTQVSDLKGWESAVVPVYNFGQVGIPYNVLVDPKGIIIAERLRGPDLEAKLAEVLK